MGSSQDSCVWFGGETLENRLIAESNCFEPISQEKALEEFQKNSQAADIMVKIKPVEIPKLPDSKLKELVEKL